MKKIINILHLRDTAEIGGPGKTILETIAHINSKGFKLHIAVFLGRNEKPDTPFIREAEKRNFSVHMIRSVNQYDPRIIFEVLRLVKKLNIHIIHSHELLSDIIGYIVSKLCKVSIITTLHGWIEYKARDRIKIILDKKIAGRYDKVIVVSKTMRKQMIETGAAREKLEVLHNSIVVENYSNNRTTGYLSEITGKKIEGPIIGTIGRLSREKGHKDFIKAAVIVLEKKNNATFVLVGDGPEKDYLKKLAKESNLDSKIIFTGYLSNIQRVFVDMDLMVLPSYTEGLPNVVLESLFMEVPVIATAVGGTPEIIRDYETGVLIEAGKPEKMAVKIMEYFDEKDKYKKMAIKGRLLVQEEFNFRQRTKKLETIYADIINN